MSMYGGLRDISLFRNLNRELLGNIITQQIVYYKFDVVKNKINMYGEAVIKNFLQPVLLNCLVERTDQVWESSDLGPDITAPFKFAFFKDDLIDANVFVEVGDIIMWYERYFEVQSLIENQLFAGKNPDYPYNQNPLNPGLENFGSSISLVVDCQLVPADKLGITKERS